jgi:hypothetical protein
VKYLCFSLFVFGCAQAHSSHSTSTTGSTTGGTTAGTTGGMVDMAMEPHDLAGADFAGADFAMSSSMNDLAGTCDLITQAGCNANEKCVPGAMGNLCASKGATSVPTAGLCLMSMTPPSANDECAGGDGCITWTNFDMSKTVSICQEWCTKDADCSQPTFAGGDPPRCVGELQNTTAYKVCSISCMPFGAADGNNGCPAGLACSAAVGGTMPNEFEFTDCAIYGGGNAGDDCTAHGNQDCKPGLVCVNVSGGPTPGTKCRPLCRAGMNGDCPTSGQTCNLPQGVTSPKFGICI